MKIPSTRLAALSGLLLFLNACQTHQGSIKTATPSDIPAQFTLQTEQRPNPGDPWWQHAINDQNLISEIEYALGNSPKIAKSQSEVSQAEAELAAALADLGWNLDLNGSTKFNKNSGTMTRPTQLSIDITFPLDLFNSLQATADAAQYEAVAAVAAYQQERNNLVEDWLSTYVDLAENAQLASLLEDQIATSETLLHLTRLRFAQGQSSSVDVLQQQDQLAALKQQIPVFSFNQQEAGNTLSALAGKSPKLSQTDHPKEIPSVNSAIAISTPLALLDSRADLVEQRANLAAANSRYEAAIRSALPELDFSSQLLIKTVSGDASDLITATLSAAWSIFDSGAQDALNNERKAQVQAQAYQYLQAWIDAVADLDTLLHKTHSLKERLGLAESRLAVAEQLLKASTKRYERGVSDYLPVLSALRGLQQQQQEQIKLKAELARTRVQLQAAAGHIQNQKKS